MTKQTDVAVKEKSDVAVAAPMSDLAKAAHLTFKGSDVNLIIPRLLVKNDKSPHLDQYDHVKKGDIVETLNYEVLAGLGEKIKFIPFASESVWLITHETKNGSEFIGVEEFTGERLPFEEEIDRTTTLRRTLGVQVLLLKVDDIENDIAMPYAFTFKKSSAAAGKKLNTIMYMKNAMAKRAPWASIVEIFSVEVAHPKGNFFTVDLSQSLERAANEKELECAEYWYSKMVAGVLKVDTTTGEVME